MDVDLDPPFVKEIDTRALRGDEACKVASSCLQAMRSVIASSKCVPSATAYFAATVAALQRQGPGASATTTALLIVLRKAISATPASTICSRFNDLVASITNVLRSPDDERTVRQSLVCLMAASEAAFGAGSRPNRKLLKPVFSFLTDERDAIQHQAEVTAALILKRAATADDDQTLSFASTHLVQMLGAGRQKGSDQVPAQNAISLVKAVGSAFPHENMGAVCEAILRMPLQLGQHPCCTEGFNFVAEHLRKEPAGEQGAQAQFTLAAKLLAGQLQVPLAILNYQYICAYAKALASSVAVVTQKGFESPKNVPPLPKLKLDAAKRLLGLFAERDPSVLRGAREACQHAFSAAGKHGDIGMLEGLPELCEPLLGHESKGAFKHVFPVITALFHAVGEVRSSKGLAEVPVFASTQFAKARGLVELLVATRDKARSGEMNWFGEALETCLGASVSTFGPENVLQVAELKILETPLSDMLFEQTSRSWLLLVLKSSVKNAPLTFFATKFLPMASALKASAAQAKQENQEVVAKRYATLLEQVWALLPGFCDEPLDLGAALLAEQGKLAKQLVGVLQSEPDLRSFVWAAFSKACECTREPPTALSQSLQESNRQCLQTLSGRVIPEMFNTYIKVYEQFEGRDPTWVAVSKRLMLGSVQSYARISDPAFVGGLFKKLVARLLKATTGQGDAKATTGQGDAADAQMAGAAADVSQALPLADLASSLIPHLGQEFLELTLKVFVPMLSSGGVLPEENREVANGLQKIAYRAVQGAVEHPAASNTGSRMLELWSSLQEARQTCSATALKARLRVLEAMLKLTEQQLSPRFTEPAVRQEYMQCLTTLMPEILFHLRDQSTTVRDVARECLHLGATTAIHQELQAEIVGLLSAGLAGLTRHSKACAVDALSRVLYEHSIGMATELQDRLISVVLLMIEDSDAQVWRAVVKFVKVVAVTASLNRLERHLPQIFKLFDSRHVPTVSMLIRSIIERLAKVIPAETLHELFPKKHRPLLQYVQRQLARQLRPQGVRIRKDEADDQGEDEGKKDDGEDDDMGEEKKGKSKGPKISWEAFRGEDDMEVSEAASKMPTTEAAKDGKKRGRSDPEPPTSAVMGHAAVQQLLDAWEEESDSDDGMGSGKRKPKKGKRKRDDAGEAGTWIHEDQDVPLDFMSADAAHSVLTLRAAPQKRQRAAEVGSAGAQNRVDALRRSGLHFSHEGLLVIDDSVDEKKDEDEKGGGFTLGADTEKKPKALSQLGEQRRRRAEAKARAKAARKGSHLIKGMESFKPGKKKAQGDAKRQGTTLEPYAYVKLNPKVSKEKYKSKATESFSKVVKGVKAGVIKGRKARVIDQKNKKMKQARVQRRKASNQAKRKPGKR